MDLHQYIDPIIEFVRTHAAWAPLIVAALAFGESLAFISLILPASTVLVAIGALIGAGALDFVPVWIAAAIGAASGDWLSYWLGQKFGGPISRIWPLSRHPDLIPRGHAFVGKYGIAAIFIGRFFGPLRAAVPLAAGILQMSWWPFQIANVTSAFIWAAVLLAPGAFGYDFVNKLLTF
ncbi:MAG: DedA family protein [Xanthobacteraceae bacterium]|jgi:membrane protein DedA with SNARE-associated domain